MTPVLPLLLLLLFCSPFLSSATFLGSPLLAPYVQEALIAKKINATSSLFGSAADATISAKYGNATAVAWRRLLSGGGSVSAVAGPALGGDITCYVADDGSVAGLRYGPALVCDATPNSVSVLVGDGIVEYVDVYLTTNARIGGLAFIVKPSTVGAASVAYPCGTLKGPHALLGKRGEAVGALAGGCAPTTARRRLLQASNGTLSAAGFTAVLVPAPPPGEPSSGGYGGGGFVF